MNVLFFDTETTGLVKDWNDPSCEENPRIVQIGLMLTDNRGKVLRTVGCMVQPNGFTIPSEASRIHGITTEMALKYGVPCDLAIGTYMHLVNQADLLVAHNLKFDSVVMEGELWRSRLNVPKRKTYCTMLESTEVCGIYKNKRLKWPKLREAYEFFFNEELEDQHDALGDVIGCKRIFFEGLKVTL